MQQLGKIGGITASLVTLAPSGRIDLPEGEIGLFVLAGEVTVVEEGAKKSPQVFLRLGSGSAFAARGLGVVNRYMSQEAVLLVIHRPTKVEGAMHIESITLEETSKSLFPPAARALIYSEATFPFARGEMKVVLRNVFSSAPLSIEGEKTVTWVYSPISRLALRVEKEEIMVWGGSGTTIPSGKPFTITRPGGGESEFFLLELDPE